MYLDSVINLSLLPVYSSYQYYPLVSDKNYIQYIYIYIYIYTVYLLLAHPVFNFLLKMLKLKRGLKKKKSTLFMEIIIKWQTFTIWRCGYFFPEKFLYVFSWILHKVVAVESYRYLLCEIWYTHLLIFVIKACGMFNRCIRHRDSESVLVCTK